MKSDEETDAGTWDLRHAIAAAASGMVDASLHSREPDCTLK